MSVYGYSITREKVGFNIHFTSAIGASWTGTQFDATFPIFETTRLLEFLFKTIFT